MNKIIQPVYIIQRNKEICSNAKEVLRSIKSIFPDETYESIASRANVHMQTIQRWSSIGRSEAKAMKLLISTFEAEENMDNILLKKATPKQLRKQCEIIGWDKIINS
ncbi:hypothetical protein K7I13_07345 [Brucepastera parasyntrophica]|uniref:hypothetical protein n=1 Tax=Brucepastera parasyntrophica TaxID=2880008 RepID=UPI00210D4324|nr:hypothetical protein [Brucepastera parasyntrophica]ULQ61058.1 hypothetical protein K7I13_07345 [Brucepastera parasyntrophica]